MKTLLFSIIILFMSGCEVWVEPSPYRYSYTYTSNGYVAEAYYDPHFVNYPYSQLPDACYSHYGVEYCEWVNYPAPYTECIETWYYDEYFRLWDFYSESCYAI